MYLQKCAEIIVAHLGYLNYTQYTVLVGLEHLKLPIKDVNFTVRIPADRSGSLAHQFSSRSLGNDWNTARHLVILDSERHVRFLMYVEPKELKEVSRIGNPCCPEV